jgi:hypothetical protein
MSEYLTAKECGVMKWCEKSNSVSIFFEATSGPNVLVTFISYSETFSELQELARHSFIDAFHPSCLSNDPNDLGMMTVTMHGYRDRYRCFFKDKKDVPDHIECRILLSEWSHLSTYDKILKSACELDLYINTIIKEHKVKCPEQKNL